jgi:hypothetical protein
MKFLLHLSKISLIKIPSLVLLQGKDPLAEVIEEVFSVTKLGKFVKKTSAKKIVFGSRCFCGDYNKTSL